ncbi:methyl-accepting chemotaxis protein [Geomicrobium sp. JCM 19038]|uniref:methyl-accepting chemotaxis protein n=1 Tax=Geomicrobium sp. JCM 19038 TaxID=1460635 RepID=UPI00045F10FF|nr:methyl-accepting chemotaxis protein [Geomicrobium sp. JCM 19038]GAK06326.1 hypothetical protein JCM19038_19 [Geomicrobium sp. JCM 19038]
MEIIRLRTIRSKLLSILLVLTFCFLIGFLIIFVLLQNASSKTDEIGFWNDLARDAQETTTTFQQKYIIVTELTEGEDPNFNEYITLSEQMNELTSTLSEHVDGREEVTSVNRLEMLNQMFDTRMSSYIESGTIPSEQTWQGFEFLSSEIMDHANILEDHFLVQAEHASTESFESIHSIGVVAIIVSIVATMIAGSIFYRFITGMTSKINRLSTRASTIAAGNLDGSPLPEDGNDELAKLSEDLNEMNRHLAGTMSNMTTASRSLSSSSQELAAAVQQVNAGSTDIASSVQEISDVQTSLNEHIQQSNTRFTTVHDDLQNTYTEVQHVLQTNDESNNKVAVGKENLERSLQKMQAIKNQHEQTEKTIQLAKQSSDQVITIINHIYDVNSQTRLLSLNANIESARTKQSGEGFLVVAKQIRDLADESERSSKSISKTLKEMNDKIDNTITQTTISKKQIDEGQETLLDLSDTFNRIEHTIQSTKEMAANIEKLIRELQTSSTNVLTELITIQSKSESTMTNGQSISHTIQEQASTVESITITADELQKVSIDIDDQLQQYRS